MLNLTSQLARRKEWLGQLRLRRAYENAFATQIGWELDRVAREAAAEYERGGHASLGTVFFEHHQRMSALMPAMTTNTARAFAHRTLRKLGLPRKALAHVEVETKAEEDEIEDEIRTFSKENSAKKVTQISNTTRNRINRTITSGLRDNLTSRDIAKKIVETSGAAIGKLRARTIARTEVHAASMAGSLFAAESMDVEMVKEWVAVSDDRTRDDHADVNGQQVALDESFDVGDDSLSFPGDPTGSPEQVIDCRCVMVYATKE